MKRAGLYVRVSTIEQKNHGLSVDSQIQALKEYCKNNGYEEVSLYNDAGLSASKSYKHRPELLRMLDDCQNKKIDIILFTKLDRFFRSVPDYYACIEKMNDVPWQAIWEDYETVTSSGKFKVNIMLSIAQAESDRTSERIKAVNEYRRAKGDFVGGIAPIGYVVNKNNLNVNEDLKEGIHAFFNKYLSTMSPNKAIEEAAKYNISISRPQAIRMVRNTTYSGNANGYKCYAYITPEEQQKLIDSIESHRFRNPGAKEKTYIFSGMVRCGYCGGSSSSHYHATKRKDGRKYQYKTYMCSRHVLKRGCDAKFTIFESTLEKYLLENLEDLVEKYSQNKELSPEEIKNNNDKIKKLNTKLQRIGIRFEDGDISIEEYRTKRDTLKQEIAQIENINSPAASIELPDNWKETYSEFDDAHKKAFWLRIIKRIDAYSSKEFNVTLI